MTIQKKVTNFVNGNMYNLFLVFLVVLNVLPWLAPVFTHLGWKAPAKVIYSVYSFLCHQFAWRSIHVADHQCAWCARDTFIWGAVLAIALIVKLYRVKALKWYWVIPFVIPIALDGGVQTIAALVGFRSEEPYYISTNMMRMATGGTFGIGLGLWMMPTLKEMLDESKQ